MACGGSENVRKQCSVVLQSRALVGRVRDLTDVLVRTLVQPSVFCDYRASVRKTVFAGQNRVCEHSCVVNCQIGRHTYFSTDCTFRNVTVGSFCSVGPGAMAGMGRHPSHGWFSTAPVFFSPRCSPTLTSFCTEPQFEELLPITVGHDVWIGTRALIMDGVTIGSGAIIGAGAVVTKDVAPYAICAGVPARVLRFRYSPAIIERLLALQWWTWNDSKLGALWKTFHHGSDEAAIAAALSRLESASK